MNLFVMGLLEVMIYFYIRIFKYLYIYNVYIYGNLFSEVKRIINNYIRWLIIFIC